MLGSNEMKWNEMKECPGDVNQPPSLGIQRMAYTRATISGRIKGALYRIQILLLTRRGKTSMYTVGIVFEFYTVPL